MLLRVVTWWAMHRSKNITTLRRSITGVIVTMMLTGNLFAGTASARDKGDQVLEGRLNLAWPQVKSAPKEYEYIPSGQPGGNNGTIVNTPVNCRKSEACDTIRVDVDPGNLDEAFYMQLTLDWPNHCIQPQKPSDPATCPPGSVNLNIHMWEPVEDCKDDPATPNVDECKEPDGSPLTEWLGRNTSTTKWPETFKFGADLAEPAFFYIVIVNATQGANPDIRPYSLTVEFKLASFGDYEPPEETPPSSPRPSPSAAKPVARLSPSPKATLKAPKVPGADGQLGEHGLTAFKGRQEQRQDDGVSPLIYGLGALFGFGALLFGYFFVRGRRASPGG